jgi:hypothetical protein
VNTAPPEAMKRLTLSPRHRSRSLSFENWTADKYSFRNVNFSWI